MERATFEMLVDHHEARLIPDQDLHAVTTLGPKNENGSTERIVPEDGLNYQ